MARFAKGQSGNPGGRPKALGDIRELARRHSGEAVQVLVHVMGDASAAPSARVGAASALLDRGWGRPAQTINASMESNNAMLDAELLGDASDLLKLFKERSENKRITGDVDAERKAETTPPLDVTAH